MPCLEPAFGIGQGWTFAIKPGAKIWLPRMTLPILMTKTRSEFPSVSNMLRPAECLRSSVLGESHVCGDCHKKHPFGPGTLSRSLMPRARKIGKAHALRQPGQFRAAKKNDARHGIRFHRYTARKSRWKHTDPPSAVCAATAPGSGSSALDNFEAGIDHACAFASGR